MRTATSAPNKGNDDIKPEGQTYASGTGRHMKTTDKKRKYDTFFYYLLTASFWGGCVWASLFSI